MSQVSFAVIPIVGSILAAIAAMVGSFGLLEAILDFRAKRKARDVLSRIIQDDPELRSLIEQSKKPSEEDIEKVSSAVSKALENELSPGDMQRVDEGLHQSNKSNEWRYIHMLFWS
jgi:hypothetical protein